MLCFRDKVIEFTTLAYCPVIQKEVDGLLTKGATDPHIQGVGFTRMSLWYLNVQKVYDPYSILNNSTAI